jgi:TonB family protein
MSAKVKVALLLVVAVSFAACPFVAAAGEKEGVFTVFRVLVGTPAAPEGGGGSVLMVPGPVVMLGKSPEDEAKDVLDLMAKLKDGYRLGEVSLAASVARTLEAEAAVDIPPVGSDLKVRVTLLGFDERKATYAVSIKKGGEAPSQAKVVIGRGNRGIVGSRDGVAAPYLFLTIEPLQPYRPARLEGPDTGEVTPPKLVSKVTPSYPEQARKAGIDGVVLLEVRVGTDGVVRDLKPLRSEPMGLTEAAIKAVSQWRYEPARDKDGKVVPVVMTVTISFLFDRSKTEKAKT